MEYEIREIKECELDDCLNVIHQGFQTVAKEFGLTEENCPTNGAFMKKERLLNEREKGNDQYGLFYNNQLTGFVELAKIDEKQYSLEKLAVLPKLRHKGFGKKLLDYAKEQVINKNGSIIKIGIIEENTRLKNWYLDYGFVHKGTRIIEHLPFTVGFMELDAR